MTRNRFLKELEKHLPTWQQNGWISKENSAAILNHVDGESSRFNLLTFGVAVLGVLLLGSGIITYFAANWSDMTKLTKLILLFSALYMSFFAATHFLKSDHSPLLGQALLVLGVIIFGANIMLIAQIYHIDEHYPNGVLFWTLGGLITSYVFKSHAVLALTISLSVIWTVLESSGFNQVHIWYLAVWICFVPIIFKQEWSFALHLALVALLLWSVFTYFHNGLFRSNNNELYLMQLYFIAYISLFIIGMLCSTYKKLEFFAKPVQSYSAFAALTSFYFLTFPEIQRGHAYLQDSIRPEASSIWVVTTFAALFVLVALTLWHRARTNTPDKAKYLIYGQLLIVAVVLTIVLNLFLGGGNGSLMAIILNLIFFSGMVWLLFAGTDSNNRTLINLAFIFFAIALLTRYFDTFWSLLNRSFFFMAGGLILIIGGYLLEKQRRKFTSSIKQ